MNLFHLFSIGLLALGFSAQPTYHITNASRQNFSDTITVVRIAEEGYIPWTPTDRLTWSDFLSEPRRGTDAVASTSTSLGIAYQVINNKLTYHITCNFSKQKSWGLMKTDYILAHEQGHFDITEIFARRLNEALQNYEFNKKTFKHDINQIYQDIVQQKEDYQHLYDNETDHSRNKKLQYDWLDTIQKMLDESAPYASYP